MINLIVSQVSPMILVVEYITMVAIVVMCLGIIWE